MKHLLLTSCILATVLSQANAQVQVSKSDFIGNINALGSYISQNNPNGEEVEIHQLGAFIRSQILYLKTTINTSMATHTADSTRADADLKAANKANNMRAKVTAENEGRRAQEELAPINQYKSNLATDETLQITISSLCKNVVANKDALIAALGQFAATLQ